jgi:outer membrane protein insertion porin family
MKKILVGFLVLFSANLFAQTFVIEDIRLEGIQRVSSGSVFAAMPARVGDLVDEVVIQDSIRSLFATGFFTDIRIERDQNVLVVRLTERPAIASIEIEGNKIIETEQLLESMTDAGLFEGQILQPATLEAVSRSLAQEYVAQGHYGSVVDSEIIELPRNRVGIRLDIDEGQKASIKRITIIGNELYDDKELLDLFELEQRDWLSWIDKKDRYSREALTGDLERLEAFYRDQGYFEFGIRSSQIAISPDKTSVFITVNISEGEVYRITDVGFLGEMVVPEAALSRYLLVRPGQIYSQAAVTATKDLLLRILGNEGYTFAQVEDIPEFEPGSGEVDLKFFIDPNQRVYVRRVEFRGNLRTDDEVLRREMRQLESASASDQLIELGKTRLDRLGFFREVNTETPPVAGTTDQIDVIYTVEEQASGSISASLGYAEYSGFLLGFNIQENNFLGSGNSLGVGINKSTYQDSYSLSYTNPYFTPEGVSAGFSIFSRATDYGEINISTYTTDILGFNVNFGYPLSEISYINFGFGYEQLDLTTGSFASNEIAILAPTGQDEYDTFKFDTSIGRSTLNRGIFPTAGSAQSLAFEMSIPGSDIDYYKLTLDAEAFFPIYGDFKLKLESRLGYGDSYGGTERMPFFENFYAGGIGSVRGFEQNQLGPRESGNVGNFPDPIGGNVLALFGASILLPTPFLPDSRSVQASLYFDAGNVFDTNCTPDPSGVLDTLQLNCFEPDIAELRYSAGIGVTWLSGFGPMSFSFGRPVNGGEFEDREMFQFTLGQTF